MSFFDRPVPPLSYSTTFIPLQRVHGEIITGAMVILADIVIFAALTLKRPAHTRKDDVLIAVNVAIDALTAIRHVAFDVNTLVTYAEHDGCK